jgi:hypothetical protein
MYDSLLQTIALRMQPYGERLQPPCSSESLEKLRHPTELELGGDLPDAYLRFLAKADGLDWNGLVVYGSERSPILGYSDRFIDGFVEANLDFRDHEPLNGFYVFAEDGVALYTQRIPTEQFEIILSVGLSSLETFPSFDALLVDAFSAHL